MLYADNLQQAAATAAELKANNSPLQLQSIQEANSAAEAARARDAGMVGTSVSLAAKDDILEQSVFTSADMQYVPLSLVKQSLPLLTCPCWPVIKSVFMCYVTCLC